MEDPIAGADAGASGAKTAPDAGLEVAVGAEACDEETASQKARKTKTVTNLTPEQQEEVKFTLSTQLN